MAEERKITLGVPKETFPGEARVAVTPAVLPALSKVGVDVVVESGAGGAAGFPDDSYRQRGATVAASRADVFAADAIAQVRTFGANPEAGKSDFELFRPDQTVIGFCEPLSDPERIKALAEFKLNVISMEMIPRITRAQAMDALSSQATVSGYKAVLLAASTLPKMFPMLTTAAGTIAPARVFVIGAGVAGLQAIATAKRLGAVVEAYDVRPAVKEQVQSVGAKFVELELETSQSEDKGGYAKEMDEEFYRKQREMMTKVVAGIDVVITTAAIPGRRAPVLITREMVAGMQPGSVIVDLAAAGGGNCELTRPDETVHADGVTVLGPTNLPASVPYHASAMYAKNITALVQHLVKDGELRLDNDDQITNESLLTRGGNVVHARLRVALELDVETVEEAVAKPEPAGAGKDAVSEKVS